MPGGIDWRDRLRGRRRIGPSKAGQGAQQQDGSCEGSQES